MITKDEIRYYDKMNLNTPAEQREFTAIWLIVTVLLIALIMALLLMLLSGFCITQAGQVLGCIRYQ